MTARRGASAETRNRYLERIVRHHKLIRDSDELAAMPGEGQEVELP
jgi:hypothetical protein